MEKFVRLDSFMAPLNRSHVDTDQIIPKQFLRSISRSGFGPFLFDEWRYLDHGELGMDCARRPRNPDFVLNDERYAGARVLLTGGEFWLRVFAGACGLGFDGVWVSGGDCAVFWGYFCG